MAKIARIVMYVCDSGTGHKEVDNLEQFVLDKINGHILSDVFVCHSESQEKEFEWDKNCGLNIHNSKEFVTKFFGELPKEVP